MDPVEQALRDAGAIATLADLRAAGCRDRQVQRAVADGTITRIRRAFYATRDAHPEAVAAVRIGGRLAGLSCARSHGLWADWVRPLHVVVPGHASRLRLRDDPMIGGLTEAEVRVHWNDDRLDVASRWRVDLRRCLAQIVRWHSRETAIACLDTALTRKLLTTSVRDYLSVAVPSWAELQHACRAGAGSGVESIVRQRLEARGLSLSQQVVLPGSGPVDFVVDGTRLIIEIDGFEFHSSPEKFADDRRRDAEATALGYDTLRFAAVQVRDQWPWVEQMVLRAVARAHA